MAAEDRRKAGERVVVYRTRRVVCRANGDELDLDADELRRLARTDREYAVAHIALQIRYRQSAHCSTRAAGEGQAKESAGAGVPMQHAEARASQETLDVSAVVLAADLGADALACRDREGP